jgi:hypothetical protein
MKSLITKSQAEEVMADPTGEKLKELREAIRHATIAFNRLQKMHGAQYPGN